MAGIVIEQEILRAYNEQNTSFSRARAGSEGRSLVKYG